ncbi:MAG: hypothetical protein HYW48_07735 [Deltaproteobacteria bacterium]|nr:hypothetical protein [Deltaproteobacteria bacterium]
MRFQLLSLLILALTSESVIAVTRLGEVSKEEGEDFFQPRRGYKLQLSVGKPTFTKMQYYDELFGSTEYLPTFGFAYKFLGIPMAQIGAGFKMSVYSANGNQALKKGTSPVTIEKATGQSRLTVLPYQIFLIGQVSPFYKRYIVFDVWAGYEELYFEDVRLPAAGEVESSDRRKVVTSGWDRSMTYGVSANFLLNPLEERAVQNLYNSMGFRFIYFGPFIEFVSSLGEGKGFLNQQQTTPVDFSRQTFGITFMFET